MDLQELKKRYLENCKKLDELGDEGFKDYQKEERHRQSNREFMARLSEQDKLDFNYVFGELEI